jgi:hypothetical protein
MTDLGRSTDHTGNGSAVSRVKNKARVDPDWAGNSPSAICCSGAPDDTSGLTDK